MKEDEKKKLQFYWQIHLKNQFSMLIFKGIACSQQKTSKKRVQICFSLVYHIKVPIIFRTLAIFTFYTYKNKKLIWVWMKNLRNFSWVFGGLFKKLLGQNQTKVSYKKYWVYYEFFGKYRINKLRANRV